FRSRTIVTIIVAILLRRLRPIVHLGATFDAIESAARTMERRAGGDCAAPGAIYRPGCGCGTGRCKSGPTTERTKETARHANGVCLMKRLSGRSAIDRQHADQ